MIRLKDKKQIAILREGGEKLSRILQLLQEEVKPGISTIDLDKKAEELIAAHGATPSFRGFLGYPAALCTSVNEELVHGIPSGRRLVEGDIIGIDCGIWYDGLCTDMAVTVPVGAIDSVSQKLLNVTKESLQQGLSKVRPGGTIGDYGSAVQAYVEKNNMAVVRGLVGHGVGFEVHEEPRVPNFGKAGTGVRLEPGMVLALEPMVGLGGYGIMTASDGWTISMQDGLRSAHFEATIVITADGWKYITPIFW